MLLAPIRSPHHGSSRTNQIATQGYVSRTNHIIAFEYLAPITVFGYYFLINDVMDHGAVHKE